MNDAFAISPHILVSEEGVLTLPTDDDERQGIALFTTRDAAYELAPKGFLPVYCGPEELEKLAEVLHIWLVALVGGELEGAVFTTDAFVAVLQMGEEQ